MTIKTYKMKLFDPDSTQMKSGRLRPSIDLSKLLLKSMVGIATLFTTNIQAQECTDLGIGSGDFTDIEEDVVWEDNDPGDICQEEVCMSSKEDRGGGSSMPSLACCKPSGCDCAKDSIRYQIDKLEVLKELKLGHVREIDRGIEILQALQTSAMASINEIANRTTWDDISLSLQTAIGLVPGVTKCLSIGRKVIKGEKCIGFLKRCVPRKEILWNEIKAVGKEINLKDLKASIIGNPGLCLTGLMGFVVGDELVQCLTINDVIAKAEEAFDKLQVMINAKLADRRAIMQRVNDINAELARLKKELSKKCCPPDSRGR